MRVRTAEEIKELGSTPLPEGYRSVKAAAEAIGYSQAWASKLIERGDLVAETINGVTAVSDAAIANFKENYVPKQAGGLRSTMDPLRALNVSYREQGRVITRLAKIFQTEEGDPLHEAMKHLNAALPLMAQQYVALKAELGVEGDDLEDDEDFEDEE